MTKKTWIEVALNGAWTRRLQPRIPVTSEEIVREGVACARAGAAIVLAHTLDSDNGRQNNDVENCITFLSGIRAQVDAITYPNAVPPPNQADWKRTLRNDGVPAQDRVVGLHRSGFGESLASRHPSARLQQRSRNLRELTGPC